MGSRRNRLIRDLMEEQRRIRYRFYQQLSADYNETARRLMSAYQTHVKAIEAQLTAIHNGVLRGRDITDDLLRLRENAINELNTLERTLLQEARRMQASGGRAGFRMGLENLGDIGVGFNMPTLESIQSAIYYVDLPAFQTAINRFGEYYGNKIADEILAAVAQGLNPRATAMLISGLLNNQVPLYTLQNMTRTVQLWSARRGTQLVYQRTGVEKWIWSSALDSRTCPGCWAKHGTVHPVDEILNDHHQGRCAMVPVTPQWSDLIGTYDYDAPEPLRGEAIFRTLSREEQQAILGPGRYALWANGQITFDDIPTTYQNAIYGTMTRPKTLAELRNQQ